ncbi:Transcription initiation factor TFIID subunit 5 [Morella rubra]|uniref:Transcription initiation factor TFIID subunit 5 n=1 Tax=Morella rubra TaxID=262757 RepID=A0A6A1V7V6_9ROSI|nr:Transcription initiation factor TFIID subunit 5 [Morella rubra]
MTPVDALLASFMLLCWLIISTEVEKSILEDLRNRVQLNSLSLPSISLYTFVNTHNGLNCSSISHDGSLVAGGFSDSSLKIWDMAKLGQEGCVTVNLLIMLTLGTTDLLIDIWPHTYLQGLLTKLPHFTFSTNVILISETDVSLRKESPAAPVFPLTSKTTKENVAIIGEKGVRG